MTLRVSAAAKADPARQLSGSFKRRALRAIFYAGGVVATAAGLHTVIAGGRSLPNQGVANPSVESELRFYAAFYVAFGITLLRVAPRAEREPAAVRSLAGALFLAGLARASGWLAVGRPHRLQIALLGIELGAPPAIVALSGHRAALG